MEGYQPLYGAAIAEYQREYAEIFRTQRPARHHEYEKTDHRAEEVAGKKVTDINQAQAQRGPFVKEEREATRDFPDRVTQRSLSLFAGTRQLLTPKLPVSLMKKPPQAIADG
ncbi:hypothetical protein [Hongsoonwoonella zoysiae]|uniref:hypothetical protein n=1 Tax=Hongsoonwoonella zoysiae TaxID=2821844 RepID=UPI0031B5A28C